MPRFSKVSEFFNNAYVGAALMVLLAFASVAAVVFKPLALREGAPVIRTQDISEFTQLIANK